MIATAVSHYPKLGDAPGQQKLRQAIARFDRGAAGQEELDRVAGEVTAEVIKEQEAAGLDLVTDGQVRWQDPVTYLCSRLEGFEITGLLRWFESNTYYRQPVAVAPVSWRGPILVDDYRFARAQATRPVKPVLTGPYTLGTLSQSRLGGGHSELVLQLAQALNQELKALAAEGPDWIQVDEPAIALNPSVSYPRDFGLFREAMAALTAGVEARLSLYVYHGSAADIPGLFDLPFSLIGLDLVQGGAGWSLVDGWDRRRGLGLGLVDARNVRLEDERELAARVRKALEVSDEVHLSPSCGLEFLPRESARAKLELVGRIVRSLEVRV